MGNVERLGNPGSGFGIGTASSGLGPGAGGSDAASSAQRFAKYRERCAPLNQLTRLDDGGILEGWKLQGVLLVIRHGDRGAMSHVHANGINCGVPADGDSLVNRCANPTSTAIRIHQFQLDKFHPQISQLSTKLEQLCIRLESFVLEQSGSISWLSLTARHRARLPAGSANLQVSCFGGAQAREREKEIEIEDWARQGRSL